MNTQTKPTPKLKFSTGRGRPKKVTEINRRLSVSTEDFKDAIALMHNGKSLTKIEKATSLNLKSLRAIRKFAIDQGYIIKKEAHSLANLRRSAQKAIPMPSESFSEMLKAEKIAVETVKPTTTANKTLTIDFKGIMMQVEITSVEVKGDTIVVR